jgi:hypothetical protein
MVPFFNPLIENLWKEKNLTRRYTFLLIGNTLIDLLNTRSLHHFKTSTIQRHSQHSRQQQQKQEFSSLRNDLSIWIDFFMLFSSDRDYIIRANSLHYLNHFLQQQMTVFEYYAELERVVVCYDIISFT